MIQATFSKSQDRLFSVNISGHADFDEYGKDIVCASVTSAVMLTANALTDVLLVNGSAVEVSDAKICISLPKQSPASAFDFMQALYLHLTLLSEDYKDNLTVTILEV